MNPLLPLDRGGLPPALLDLVCWCPWVLETHNGRTGKVPIKPVDDGFSPYARPNHPAHRWTLDICLRLVDVGAADGVGIMVGNGLVAIDLDDCFEPDGTLKQWAYEIVRRLNTYTELSPGGGGLHLVLFCDTPLANRDCIMPDGGRVQFFGENHFCTLTGQVQPHWCKQAYNAQERTDFIRAWHEELWPPAPPPSTPFSSTGVGVDDSTLLDTMFQAPTGPDVRRLWDAATSRTARRI
jgi:primase-polymerase (primpol)-like protein